MWLLKPWAWRRTAAAQEVDPEIAAIMQELDDELAREHELTDELEGTTRDTATLLRTFAQYCTKVMVVGSYRRGATAPGDMDILYIPKDQRQVMEFVERAADDERGITQPAEGTWRCTINELQVDFIASTDKTWGSDMLYYTGSREFLQRVGRHAARRGYQVTQGARVGKFDDDGYGRQWIGAFSGWSEEKILRHLGLDNYLDPHKRNIEAAPTRDTEAFIRAQNHQSEYP